ncbi:hypothetical protein MBM_08429 [Drepanopeziza brunnea f. sp. 'multigermtubi' MB_m1]|uniref:Uncharacterized protein n=1 Tax=Marssonina brunnea f. sp. multigermtubi (strain MB_m1) TaxID=1072389 RepID=K1WKD4_MARBU|nr:uncharacterized protein MBM_08429 [Drepanopeziza brunnea f. sp. 'multigermtubi' MB_m1]EKD13346.1 hypothetical protein MBM_08429 [Drepanopeziza brunnea f. sp. 'multigermtubi' MB_m1]
MGFDVYCKTSPAHCKLCHQRREILPTAGVMASKPNSSNYSPISARNSSDREDGSTTIGNASERFGFLPEVESKYRQAPIPRNRRILDIAATIVLTLLATATAQVIFNKFLSNAQPDVQNAIQRLYGEEQRHNPQHRCGNSSTEAVQHGCAFDMSVLGWVPEACYDDELHQHFLDYGWRFFEDELGTREVFEDRLAASAGTREPFWVQHGFHVTHCQLAWERMHRAIQRGARLTTHLLNFHHTHHCGGILEARTDLMQINAQIFPLLNTC